MSIITPDNLVFSPSQFGAALFAANKPIAINKIILGGKNGFEWQVKATSEKQAKQLSVSFECEFMGDLPIRSIALFQDNDQIGLITREVEDIGFDIFTLQQGFIYIAGLTVDFGRDTTSITINRYKNNATAANCDGHNQSLSVIDAMMDTISEKITENLISADTPNELTLGSDHKLLVAPETQTETDFLAYYLLAKG